MDKDTLSDDELVTFFKQGDASCFEELVYRYKNTLFQYIMVMVRDEGAAGDLFQEVFISFFKHADRYQAQGKFKSWLFTAARNRVLNFFRDKQQLFSLDEPDEEGNPVWHDTLPSDETTPQDALENAELGRRIASAGLQLPPKQREIIYLRQYMAFKEIAFMLGRPLGTVLAQYQRGVKKMQQILQQQEAL